MQTRKGTRAVRQSDLRGFQQGWDRVFAFKGLPTTPLPTWPVPDHGRMRTADHNSGPGDETSEAAEPQRATNSCHRKRKEQHSWGTEDTALSSGAHRLPAGRPGTMPLSGGC